VAIPNGLSAQELVAAAREAAEGGLAPVISVAPGPLSARALRIGHTGSRATPDDVLAAVAALGLGLQSLGIACDLGAASAAVLGE
jgi:aspartate aminotransferase-like enzyme